MTAPKTEGYLACDVCRPRKTPPRRPRKRVGWLKCPVCKKIWRWKSDE